MDMLITADNIAQAADAVRARADIDEGAVAIVLGSGLGGIADAIESPVFVDYEDVPHMARSTVQIHKGRFVIGKLAGRQVICMQGRLHLYEGYTAQQVAFPIYVMHALGAKELIVTNAAGGIDESFEVGDLMLITDHINMLCANPCIGPEQPDVAPRFFDMTHAYAPELRERARKAAVKIGVTVREGVYVGTPGPSFETPAEIRMFRTMGASSVGMSTVLEVIAANSLSMKVLGISMISNPAAGILDEPLDMEDVSRAAVLAAENARKLIVAMLG